MKGPHQQRGVCSISECLCAMAMGFVAKQESQRQVRPSETVTKQCFASQPESSTLCSDHHSPSNGFASCLAATLGDFGHNAVEFNVVLVVCLDFRSDAVERAFQRLLGRGIEHFGLRCKVRGTGRMVGEQVRRTWIPALSGLHAMKVILLLFYQSPVSQRSSQHLR